MKVSGVLKTPILVSKLQHAGNLEMRPKGPWNFISVDVVWLLTIIAVQLGKSPYFDQE
jgi:hypothetical protein